MDDERSRPREFLEVGDELWDMRQLDREIEATRDLAESPERVRDSFTLGCLTVRRLVHHAQPPGEELGWELSLKDDGRERVIYFGREATHDPGRISDELVANKDEISRRMLEEIREQPRPVREMGHGL